MEKASTRFGPGIVVLVLGAGCFVARASAADQAIGQPSRVTAFAAETWYTALPQRGDIRCPGGGPPSDALMPPWCEPGTKTLVRDRVLSGVMQSSEPRTTGFCSVTMNMNLESATFTGPIWGTFRWDVAGRGTWEGTWTGEFNGMGAGYRYVGHGTGEFAGMQIEAYAVWVAGKGERLSGHIVEQ